MDYFEVFTALAAGESFVDDRVGRVCDFRGDFVGLSGDGFFALGPFEALGEGFFFCERKVFGGDCFVVAEWGEGSWEEFAVFAGGSHVGYKACAQVLVLFFAVLAV